MEKNDILKRLRYTFNLRDTEVIETLALAEKTVEIATVKSWFKKEGDDDYKILTDNDLASFLNGFITKMRGAKDGKQPENEQSLNNNLILRKLKIALNLKDIEMIEIFDLADMRISKGELSAFFRNTKHRHYRECKDQFLRNFLLGLQLKHRPKEESSETPN